MKDPIVQVKLRMPKSLVKLLKLSAKKNGRSYNYEAVDRIHESFIEQINKERHSEIILWLRDIGARVGATGL